MNKAEYWIEKLELIKHPEGGWYKEVYRSDEKIKKEHLPERFSGDRYCSTSIYFLLTSDAFSAFHRIKSDELWHFYEGDAVTVHMVSRKGEYSFVKLGKDEEIFQFEIPHGTWFAAEVKKPGSFALVGCTVSPGFDYEDLEIGNRDKLIKNFPAHKEIIQKFTR